MFALGSRNGVDMVVHIKKLDSIRLSVSLYDHLHDKGVQVHFFEDSFIDVCGDFEFVCSWCS